MSRPAPFPYPDLALVTHRAQLETAAPTGPPCRARDSRSAHLAGEKRGHLQRRRFGPRMRAPPSYSRSAAPLTCAAIHCPFASGAMPSNRPHATSVGQVIATGVRTHCDGAASICSAVRRAARPSSPRRRARPSSRPGRYFLVHSQPLGRKARIENAHPMAARSSAGRATNSRSGYEAPPTPPGEVQTSARRSTRCGQVTASSCATMPPKLTPITRRPASRDGRAAPRRPWRSQPWCTVRRTRRAAEAALIVRHDVEAIGERPDQRRTAREGCPRAVQEQQPRAAPAALVEIDPVHDDGRHDGTP